MSNNKITMELEYPTHQQIVDMVCKEREFDLNSEIGKTISKNLENHIELFSLLTLKLDEDIDVLQNIINSKMKENKYHLIKNNNSGVFSFYQSQEHFENNICPSIILSHMNNESKNLYSQLENSKNYIFIGFTCEKNTKALCLFYEKDIENIYLAGFLPSSNYFV